jgi:hypothetical protein
VFASALLSIPKTLAVNAAKDSTELVAKLCSYHNAADSDDEDEEDERPEDRDQEVAEEDQDDDLVIGGDASRNTKAKSEKDIVSPHSIDGFWVQRQISEVYPDPVTAADKAASILSILGSESSARDCENQLMELFDYQSFHITTKFLKNRDVIVWCTKLMHSDADEHVNVVFRNSNSMVCFFGLYIHTLTIISYV